MDRGAWRLQSVGSQSRTRCDDAPPAQAPLVSTSHGLRTQHRGSGGACGRQTEESGGSSRGLQAHGADVSEEAEEGESEGPPLGRPGGCGGRLSGRLSHGDVFSGKQEARSALGAQEDAERSGNLFMCSATGKSLSTSLVVAGSVGAVCLQE